MTVILGDVSATDEQIVTPNWSAPIVGTEVWLSDQSTVDRRLPLWAVIGAIVLFPLGLLLLLLNEPVYGGYMQVNIVNGDHSYLTRVPTRGPHAVGDLYELAKQIRALAA